MYILDKHLHLALYNLVPVTVTSIQLLKLLIPFKKFTDFLEDKFFALLNKFKCFYYNKRK